jgi:cyclase
VTTAHVPEHAEIPPPSLQEVDKGIYAYIQLDGSWGLNNTGFIAGNRGVAVIDTCFTEARTRAFIDAIGGVTDRPVQTLVNTHHHGDHTYGNYLFPQAAIVGHRLCRQEVLAGGVPAAERPSPLFPSVHWGDLQVSPPFLTFDENLTLHVDDLAVELIFVGPAHTTNDVVAWIPERKLLFTGDVVFNGGTPFVIMGSVAGSLQALDRLRQLGAERIVPGHGAVCGPELIDDVAAYLRFVQDTARAGHAAGRLPLDVARSTELGRFAAWHDSERFAANLHRAYSELRGEPLGTSLDLQPAIADMIAFNGGQPVRCLA